MAPKYILLMGVQGAGKGTQADILKSRLGLPHVSTGVLFRAMKTLDTPLAREIQAIMNEGRLVPDEITIQVVRERLKQPDAAQGALFDGFPRTLPQAEALDKLLAELGSKVAMVAFFNLDRQTAIERISGRWECTTDSGHIYHTIQNPPKLPGVCDIDGAPLRQRPDDTPEAAAKRIDLFFKETAPLLDYYRKQNVLVEIDGAHSIDEVTNAVLTAVNRVNGA